jgi:hypothetical protein
VDFSLLGDPDVFSDCGPSCVLVKVSLSEHTWGEVY